MCVYISMSDGQSKTMENIHKHHHGVFYSKIRRHSSKKEIENYNRMYANSSEKDINYIWVIKFM